MEFLIIFMTGANGILLEEKVADINSLKTCLLVNVR